MEEDVTPRKKAEDDDDGASDDAGSDDAGEGKGDAEGGDGDDAGSDDLTSHIRRVVTEVVEKVLGDRTTSGAGTTQAQDEGAIRRMVKEAQEALHKEEQKDSRFKEVSETVETLKKAVEKAPARAGIGGKAQRFFWGEAD